MADALDHSIYAQGCDQSEIPDLASNTPDLSHFEFWPSWLFYLPMKIYGAWLGIKHGCLTLPTVSNPLIYAGGFVGESKAQIAELVPQISRHYFAQHIAVNAGSSALLVAQALLEKEIDFPLVIKPDQGERGAGVQVVYSLEGVMVYLKQFSPQSLIILQELCDYTGEVGLFYIRHPHEEKGRIFSLTMKYFPFVTGDGKSSLRELILADARACKIADLYLSKHTKNLDMVIPDQKRYRLSFAGSHCRGAIFKDASAYITPAMEEAWGSLVKTIPELYFCRFDVRFQNMKDLETLENIKIIEINGAGAEATHIWDSKMTLWQAYKVLFEQYRMLFSVSRANRKRGFKPLSVIEAIHAIRSNKKLVSSYPPTH